MIFNYLATRKDGQNVCAIDTRMFDQFTQEGFYAMAFLADLGFTFQTRKITRVVEGQLHKLLRYKLGVTPLDLLAGMIDCSTFIQAIFAECGISLPRLTPVQAEVGITVESIQELKPGDLIFFEGARSGLFIHNSMKRIGHVVMVVSNDEPEKQNPRLVAARNEELGVDYLDLNTMFGKGRGIKAMRRIIQGPVVTMCFAPPDRFLQSSFDLYLELSKNWKQHQHDIVWPTQFCNISPMLPITSMG